MTQDEKKCFWCDRIFNIGETKYYMYDNELNFTGAYQCVPCFVKNFNKRVTEKENE